VLLGQNIGIGGLSGYFWQPDKASETLEVLLGLDFGEQAKRARDFSK